ncbi:hypothetical protein AB205_0018050 [Aquarana catesbeiana]|uniref:Uncharacterized protein n=1 Tax=Aquarana catesbeiana TaxID=8400 RepID=A0A2G9RLX8_AQUCT|nr:hypothetical protein AB205_0018050 [Aquarana catesbeiana]
MFGGKAKLNYLKKHIAIFSSISKDIQLFFLTLISFYLPMSLNPYLFLLEQFA